MLAETDIKAVIYRNLVSDALTGVLDNEQPGICFDDSKCQRYSLSALCSYRWSRGQSVLKLSKRGNIHLIMIRK